MSEFIILWQHHINMFKKKKQEWNPKKICPFAWLFTDPTAFGSKRISYWHNIVIQGQLPTWQHSDCWPINTGARKAFAVRKIFKCSTSNVRAVYLLTVLPHAQHDSLYSTSHKGTAVLEKLTSIQNTLQCLPSTAHQSVSHWHTTHSFAPFRQ